MINHVTRLAYLCTAASALCLAQNAFAQDSHWNGTTADTSWSNPNNWTPVGVPPPGNPSPGYTGNVWLDAANGDSVMTINAGDTESPGVGNSTEVFNTIFGPEFGATLVVKGTLNFDWLLFPVQNDPTPARRTYVILEGNASVNTSGAALGIGDSWFYTDAPYETVSLYNNSQYNSLGGAGLWLGGHLDIYGSSSFLVNGYVNMDNAAACNDGTRSIVMGGGTLTLPENSINAGNSGSVYSWIQRGVLRAYGKGEDTNDLVISDNTVNTIITTVPLGGSLQQVYFQPLLQASVAVGTFQQATLVGDYPSVTGVLLSSPEPGLDATNFPAPVYVSSNPNVATISTNGMVTAVGPGTAQLSATVGTFHSVNTLAITVTPVVPSLAHRYSFSAASGSTVPDSVGGADGSLIGGYTLGGGQITFDGSSGYVQLPAGILTGQNEVTVETWASFGTPINTWANLFAFGDSELAGNGQNYITFQPHTGAVPPTTQMTFGQGDPGSAGERDAVLGATLDGLSNIHIVAVYHPYAGVESFYTNGVLAATVSMFNDMIDPVAYHGPTLNGQSILSFTLGPDNLNYIGHSLYSADPTLNGSVTEFRIYNSPLTPSQIAADFALGPNQLIGTSTAPVTLKVSHSGSNVVFSWPTTSAAVTLLSSPALGASAVWTPVTLPSGAMAVSGGNYQVTMPVSGSAQFFRLSN